MPRVSVVLTVFNGAATVAQALDSITGQTFGDFEVIVVDDGSRDATPEILERRGARDERIVIITTPNRGVTYAANAALDVARGEFIARMDADDISQPQRFARQVEYLEGTPGVVAVGSQILVIDAQGVPISRQPRLGSGHVMPDRCRKFRHFPPAPPTLPHPSAMIRREALEEIGRYRRCFAMGSEDRDLWWRLMTVGAIHRIPERLLQYRRHDSNFTLTRRTDIAVAALVADLSAVARYFGIDDEVLIEGLTPPTGIEILKRYAGLLADLYPARALIFYRATRSKVPEIAAWIDKPTMRREIAWHVARGPNPIGQWRLLQTALL
jgi:glycosyltransferase involved in cell wall biosynthesis